MNLMFREKLQPPSISLLLKNLYEMHAQDSCTCIRNQFIVLSGLGVFAKQFVPRGLKVGPYEGSVVFKEDMEDIDDTSYMWEVNIIITPWESVMCYNNTMSITN